MTPTPQRCPEMCDGVQCNLVAGHAGPHAAWVQAPPSSAPPAAKASTGGLSQRRLVTILGLALAGAVLFAVVRNNPGTGRPATGNSDAALKAAMVRVITATGSISGVRTNPDGSPDIAVTYGILIVATDQPASASSICQLAAALTSDSTVPPGINHVTVISGGDEVADCWP